MTKSRSFIEFEPTRGYYIARWPELPPKLAQALKAFSPPPGPRWFRFLHLWVGTPAGLFGNFSAWFIGTGLWGPPFFALWLLIGFFIPSAVVFARTKDMG